MSDKFSVCLLTQGSGASPEFSLSQIELRPGSRLNVDAKNVLLASGFPSLNPDSGFPLSPTLQLNRDLSDCSDELLARIAGAELTRVNEATFRSYMVEPDNRLCVIGNSAKELNRFLDTYGGVIEIEPLLLGAQAPGLPTAVEVELSGGSGNYRLNYSKRSPVIRERCTYCGACGPVCPEGCLDEQLNIDFALCTACKECEKVCPTNAIDIHGVEEIELAVPAILFLDGVDLEFEGDDSGLYREENIHDFFATQFSCLVDEVIACDPALCQYSGKHSAGCTACVDVCEHGAVNRTAAGIKIDPVQCEECGNCIGVCPTGAMQYRRLGDSTFISYIRSLEIAPGTTVVLGNERTLHNLWWQQERAASPNTLFLEINRISTMSLFHLLFLFGSGAGRVVLLTEEGSADHIGLKTQVALAASLVSTYWELDKRVMLVSIAEYMEIATKHEPSPLSQVVEIAAHDNRRKNLTRLLASFADSTGRTARIKENRSLPFAEISCDSDRCTQCYACLNDCRIQALHTNSEQLALEYRSGLCVGCGVCLRVCPENALTIRYGAVLDEKFFSNVSLAEAEPMHCKECGKVFGTKKSYERVMAILSKKENVDTGHFEYCEDCRVIRLFESTQ